MKKNIPSILKNKYILCSVVFIVLFFFIDDNSISMSFSLREQKQKLESEKLFLKESIEKDSILIEKFYNNISEYEKYGRENYYMKRKDEDIFIINREK
jgi:hypothetical protein